jgi:hypothetical protein
MAKLNFLQRLIRSLAPNIFRPVPTGVLYVLLQSISREISGICPWDTGESCWRNYTQYWSINCRNILCPGYRHPLGLIAYTSRSSTTSSIDNRFDYSSFRFLSVAPGGDWLPVGTLGAKVSFDFGDATDVGGFGSGYFGTRYWGDNSYISTGVDVHIGDKWYVDCHASSRAVDAPYPDAANQGSYNALSASGTYTGDHDTTYTIELIDFWGYKQNFENALLQINLSTCTETWLDFWGSYFGLDRLLLVGGYETDSIYRARILKEITRAKGTKAVLLEEAQTYFKSDLVTITEYHNTSSGPPLNIRWDGPVLNPMDPAFGLWPWQFYINLPTQKSPAAKFIKDGSSFEEAGEIYVYEAGTGYYYGYGAFSKLVNVSPTGGLGGDWCFSIPVDEGDSLLFGCQYKFSGARFTFITPGSIDGVYAWEYWNGSGWTPLILGATVTDSTIGLEQDGGVHWLVPETGWKTADGIAYNIPSTGSNLYWVRCRVTTIPSVCPFADQMAVVHAGSTNRGVYIATDDLALSGALEFKEGVPIGYLHQPLTAPLVSVYDPTDRDRNNIYLARELSFAKPIWETGLQDIIDRLKTAGTAAIINPID